jgi:hypothetical protein
VELKLEIRGNGECGDDDVLYDKGWCCISHVLVWRSVTDGWTCIALLMRYLSGTVW